MTRSHNSSADFQKEQDVQNLADFVLFSQRSCILRLSPELTKGKVSFPQFFLLAYLAEEECLSMSSIAKMMGHSTAAATGMIDKLQELGHLKRYTAAADRRKIMVRITEQGRNLVAQMRSNIAADLAQMMAREDEAGPMSSARRVISRRTAAARKNLA
ncbi:MAG: MarR family transcriptional regulator [Akkermansia sp.]|nr:MarR family transcriptional regulator [Akkermansia sp.]